MLVVVSQTSISFASQSAFKSKFCFETSGNVTGKRVVIDMIRRLILVVAFSIRDGSSPDMSCHLI